MITKCRSLENERPTRLEDIHYSFDISRCREKNIVIAFILVVYFCPKEYVESYVNAVMFQGPGREETPLGQRSPICGDEMGIVYKDK